MRFILMLLMLLCATATTPAMAADEIFGFAIGANGVWFDDNAEPSDFEIGGNVKASLSPHFSAVGAGYYGFGHSYLRGSAGFRVTATDVNDPTFSLGLGMQYHFSSEPNIRPEEWAPDASVGWRPWTSQPRVILVALGSYGMDTNQATLMAGVRYAL